MKIEDLYKILTKIQLTRVLLRLDGVLQREIGKDQGVSQQAVSKSLLQAEKKMRNFTKKSQK